MDNSSIYEKAVFAPAFRVRDVFSLIFKFCLIKLCVYFAADLTVTCATDFHEKRYECVLVSKKCDKSIMLVNLDW